VQLCSIRRHAFRRADGARRGRYRTARLWSLDRPAPRNVEMVAQKDAVELRLPRVTVYAGVELGA